MSREVQNSNAGGQGDLVSFGQSIKINPMRPLKLFHNGQSHAFDAFDAHNGNKKYIAVVAGRESLPRWREISGYGKLLDTSFIRLMGTGVVRWPIDGGQKFVLMYQGGIGQPLARQGEIARTSWRHPDIVSYFIGPMAGMLKEMRDRSFSHGSIRPDNIFYAGVDVNAPVILGDCLSVHPLSTQPSLFLPIDKALAEPMGRGRGSLADDIYAFGVSLAVFLRKHDELSGLSDEEIVHRKLEIGSFNALIGNERFQANFLELLRGTLHDDESKRWGIDEILSWLDGSRISPPASGRRLKANRSISFNGRKYLYADQLAIDLHKDPEGVVDMIEDGRLTKWVQTSLNNSHVLDQYLQAIEYVSSQKNDPDFVAFQISSALYPHLPIFYRNRVFTYDGIGAMLAQAIMHDEDVSFYKYVLRLNILDKALVRRGVSQGVLLAQARLYDGARSALKSIKEGQGIERVLYILCAGAPCLSPMFKSFFVYNPESALRAYESLSQESGQIALFLDSHAIAFFSLSNLTLMERCLYDLNSTDKSRRINGNLRFLASLQRVTKIPALPAIASVMREALSGVYKQFKHKALRDRVRASVEEASKAGDLVTMSILIDDERTLAKDNLAFKRARAEYRMLQEEYNEYNKRLSKKSTYGVVNGRDTAALVAWGFSTVLTLLSVFAFINGYEIF